MRVKSTWPKGQKPPVQKPKGAKNKKTLLKEAIGVQNWDQLQNFIETQGIEKCVNELYALSGKDYVTAYGALTEFIKPKLARTDLIGDIKHEITVKFARNRD